MASRSAKSKAAACVSSRTTSGRGTTTPAISTLRASLRASPSSSPTSRSRTQRSFEPSLEPSPEPKKRRKPVAKIRVVLPDGSRIGIRATEVTIEVDRDYVDASSWFSSINKVYEVGRRTFTIKGKM
jgi:hypothetical protein